MDAIISERYDSKRTIYFERPYDKTNIGLNVGLRCLHLLIVFCEWKDVCSFKRTIGRSSDQSSTSRSARRSLRWFLRFRVHCTFVFMTPLELCMKILLDDNIRDVQFPKLQWTKAENQQRNFCIQKGSEKVSKYVSLYMYMWQTTHTVLEHSGYVGILSTTKVGNNCYNKGIIRNSQWILSKFGQKFPKAIRIWALHKSTCVLANVIHAVHHSGTTFCM